MQLRITGQPSDDRIANYRLYSVITAGDTIYGLSDYELKDWRLSFAVGDSAIAAVLDIEPNETTAIQVAKAA
jgi:hypothetical protein